MKKYKLLLSAFVLFSTLESTEACIERPQKIGNTGLWATASRVLIGAPLQEGTQVVNESQVIKVNEGSRSEESYSVVFTSAETTPMVRQLEDEDFEVRKVKFNSVAIVNLRTGASLSIAQTVDLNAPAVRGRAAFEDLEEGLKFGKDYVQKSCSMIEKGSED